MFLTRFEVKSIQLEFSTVSNCKKERSFRRFHSIKPTHSTQNHFCQIQPLCQCAMEEQTRFRFMAFSSVRNWILGPVGWGPRLGLLGWAGEWTELMTLPVTVHLRSLDVDVWQQLARLHWQLMTAQSRLQFAWQT